MLGKNLESKASLMRIATTIGVMEETMIQIIVLGWTFVVPVLADTFA